MDKFDTYVGLAKQRAMLDVVCEHVYTSGMDKEDPLRFRMLMHEFDEADFHLFKAMEGLKKDLVPEGVNG